MKYQYHWINKLLNNIPQINITHRSREECDDEYVAYEGGHSHGEKEGQESEGPNHAHGPGDMNTAASDKDLKLFNASMYKLKLVSSVSIFFIIAQCIGGYLANSIAIFTDTAHLASDMIGFMMAMVAMKMSMRPASKELTFGWHRAEIIGTMASIIFLLTLTIWLVFEATGRVVDPQEVKGMEMAITAVMGLCFNLIQMRILHQGEGGYHMGAAPGAGCTHDHGDGGHDHGHDHGAHGHSHEGGDQELEGGHGHGHAEKKKEGGHGHSHGEKKKEGGHSHDHGPEKKKEARRNINVDAAFLHALGDMIMSIGVCIAATIIYFQPTWVVADPICTFVFSVIVCFTVTPIVKNCINVLMEGAPSEIDSEELLKDIKAIGPDIGIHDFHLWSISVGKFAMSAHVTTNQPSQKVLKKVNKICKLKYNIDNLAIQIEDANDPSCGVTQSLQQQFIITDSPNSPKKDDGHGHGH